VPQRDGQSGAARSPRCCILTDARRARRDPSDEPARQREFATLRERLIKMGARVIEHIARIRVQLPTSCSQIEKTRQRTRQRDGGAFGGVY
jgi:hypothetical protein